MSDYNALSNYPVYIIVRERSPQDLAKEVNQQIDFGYEPVGGLCLSNGGSYLMQAMVRHHE